MSLFPKNFKVGKTSKLEELTISNLGNGLNTVESDITMRSGYFPVLRNFRRTASGSQETRYGTKWVADVRNIVNGDIVDCVYFANTIVAVTDEGEGVAIDESGGSLIVWNNAYAAMLPGTPSGWSNQLDSIDFVPFRNELIIHNGVDKPITVNDLLVATYLQDLATGSNVNVPIGKYGCVVSNYHCIAGIPAAPTTIYVSAKGTAGTFPGDPAPNDSIAIDVGAYAPQGAPEIRGIAGFRSFLIVFFETQALLIKLGVYDDSTVPIHTPEFPDTLPSFGLLGHRCIAPVTNDLRFASFGSLNSAKRNLFGNVDGDTLSDIIEPEYRLAINALSDDDRLKRCFTIYDPTLHDTTIHFPDGAVFVYNNNEKLKYRAWTTYTGPLWHSACVSSLGRIFFTEGSRIFQQGNNTFVGEAYRADKLEDRDGVWTTTHAYVVGDIEVDPNTFDIYVCIGNHTSGVSTFASDRAAQEVSPKWELYDGLAINIEMELPWFSGKNPMRLNQLRYMSIASGGTAPFVISAWVDSLYKDDEDAVIYSPALTVSLIGNDARGFGYDAGPYGGGRRSSDPRLYSFPLKFKSLKLIISGDVRQRLEIAGITFLYARGRFRR